MNKWYVEAIYSPDDVHNDRSRQYVSVEVADDSLSSPEFLAVQALVACGWQAARAELKVKEDADLGWVDLQEETAFDFEIYGVNGSWAYTLSRVRFDAMALYVVTGYNNEPIAVRPTRDLATEFIRDLDPDLGGVAKVWEVADVQSKYAPDGG